MKTEKSLKWSVASSITGVIAMILVCFWELIIKDSGSDVLGFVLPILPLFLLNPIINLWRAKKIILESRWYYILNTLYFIALILIYIKLFSIYMMDTGNLNDNMLGIFPIIMMIANYGFLISSLFLKKIEINPYNYHGK